jgi:hypothetical protein
MRILKKISLAVAAVAIVSTSSFAGQVLVGGNVPLINNITGIGVLTLDLSSPGTALNIATFIVNNNSPTFDVSWVLTNGGYFVNGARNIPMTSCAVAAGTTGSLGAGNDPVTEAVIAISAAVGTPTAAAHWATTQTSATENYAVLMNASWAAATRPLAGLYTEQVVFTITATM